MRERSLCILYSHLTAVSNLQFREFEDAQVISYGSHYNGNLVLAISTLHVTCLHKHTFGEQVENDLSEM